MIHTRLAPPLCAALALATFTGFAVADHIPGHTDGDPIFPIPLEFFDPFTGSIIFATMIGPPAGETIYETVLDVTWTTDGTRDASTMAIVLSMQIDGVEKHIFVTGADLGFAGAGTFHAEYRTDELNGVIGGGSFPHSIADLHIEPEPNCDGVEPDWICGVWGEFGAGSAIKLRLVPFCVADWDRNDATDVFDLLGYLDDWFALLPAADLDGSTVVDVFDLLAFLDSWFAGCS